MSGWFGALWLAARCSCVRQRAPALGLFLLLLSACAAAPQSRELAGAMPGYLPAMVNLADVPFFPQELYQCGPAALATVLTHTQVDVAPEALVSHVYLPARQGSLQPEMLAASRTFGRLPYRVDGRLTTVLTEVAAGNPVLVMQNLGLSRFPQWHYAVVVGYDLARQQVLLRSGLIRDYWVSLRVFERTWARADHWAFVAVAPGQIPATAEAERYFVTAAEFEQVQPAAAGAAWQVARAHWPDDALIIMGLSNWYIQNRQPDLARSELERLLTLQPDYQPARQNLEALRRL